MINVQQFLEWLISALDRLASPAEEQIQYITDLGSADMLDELALEFDDFFRPVAIPLESTPNGPAAVAACRAVDEALQSETLGWFFADLGSAEWAAIRVLAARAHSLLDLDPRVTLPEV